ncbi:hypothetical protein [Lacticaseibacillus saniviri]|uniref:hypothetical protein n=1 Tax=Lacticaseibacillus saniviri TaxID=931533 RepID=UPI001EDEA20B|nr:hypothetical protein [Lacticaseibacillus saniviri]MCG4281329.1 hypothetical protein [Lacticaseibacillus saniviri]
MLKKIVLGVLLVLWWLPSVHVDAQLDSDYDPFFGGFVARPPEHFILPRGVQVRLAPMVYPPAAATGQKPARFSWQMPKEISLQVFDNAQSMVSLQAHAVGQYSMTVTASVGTWQYTQTFSVTVQENSLAIPPMRLDPVSLSSFVGFPLTPIVRNANDEVVLEVDMIRGVKPIPGIERTYNTFHPNPPSVQPEWGKNMPESTPVQADVNYVEQPMIAHIQYGGTMPLTITANRALTLTVAGMPGHRDDTSLDYTWYINGQVVGSSQAPAFDVPASWPLLEKGNTYFVKLTYRRANQTVSLVSARAPITVLPAPAQPEQPVQGLAVQRLTEAPQQLRTQLQLPAPGQLAVTLTPHVPFVVGGTIDSQRIEADGKPHVLANTHPVVPVMIQLAQTNIVPPTTTVATVTWTQAQTPA